MKFAYAVVVPEPCMVVKNMAQDQSRESRTR